MSEQRNMVAATFVEPRGMIRGAIAQVAAREVMGAVGHMTTSSPGPGSSNAGSPLRKGQIGHLSVFADQGRPVPRQAWGVPPKAHRGDDRLRT